MWDLRVLILCLLTICQSSFSESTTSDDQVALLSREVLLNLRDALEAINEKRYANEAENSAVSDHQGNAQVLMERSDDKQQEEVINENIDEIAQRGTWEDFKERAITEEEEKDSELHEDERDETSDDLEMRGAWDDFKGSIKKAGQKVKNAFGKREDAVVTVAEEQQSELQEDERNENSDDLEMRGAWDDFKASIRKAGQKVKNAFGKREDAIVTVDEEQHSELQEDERDENSDDLEMRGAWDDFKGSFKKAGQKIKNAFGKRGDAAVTVDDEQYSELQEDKRDESSDDLEMRGAWDDFKGSIKKAGQKVKNAFGKREDAEMTVDEEQHSELQEDERDEKNIDPVLRGAWNDFKASIKKAGQKVKNAFGKRENADIQLQADEEEDENLQEDIKEVNSDELVKRGSWDDFKQKLRKWKFQMREKLGKREETFDEDAELENDLDTRERKGHPVVLKGKRGEKLDEDAELEKELEARVSRMLGLS